MNIPQIQDKIVLNEIETGIYNYEIINVQNQPEVYIKQQRFLTVEQLEGVSSIQSLQKILQRLTPELKNSIGQAILNLVDLAKKKKSTSWSNLMDQLKKSINNSISQQNLISNSFWSWVIDKFQPYTLTKEEKLNFIKLMKKYFNCNSEKDKNDPQKMFRILGNRFLQLELDLYFRHRSYITYAQFISTQQNSLMVSEIECLPNDVTLKFYDLSFDISEKESHIISQIVKKLCKDDINAFSFLSLYFLKSLQEKLKTNQYKKVEEHFNQVVKKLKKIHEPKSVDKSEQINLSITNQIPSLLKIEEDRTKRQKMQFDPERGAEQLIYWIHDKIHRAQLDFNEFQKLSAKCVNGINFKSCLKIKDKNQHFSIMRIIEKILEDYIGKKGKYKPLLDNFNIETRKLHNKIKKQSPNILKDLANAQIQLISKLINKILKIQKKIQWNIKDLLRGKCTFNNLEDIQETVNNLQGKTRKQKVKKDKEIFQLKKVKKKQKNDLFDFKMKLQSKKLEKNLEMINQGGQRLSTNNYIPQKVVSTARIRGITPINSVSTAKIKITSSVLLQEENQVISKSSQPKENVQQHSNHLTYLKNPYQQKEKSIQIKSKQQQGQDNLIQKPKKLYQKQQPDQNQTNLKYKIIQTKNRLTQPNTHDFVVILQMENGTIAELQLALNQNSFAYQFDHKFYQLERHSLFTPITNLYLNHSKWSDDFFDDFIQNFKNMAKGKSKIDQKINLEKYKKDLDRFESYIKKYKQCANDTFNFLLAQKQAEFGHIKERYDQLFQNKRSLTESKLKIPRNEEQQLKNEVNFLLGLTDYKRARQKLEFADKKTVLENPEIRELYAEILMENIMYRKMDELEKGIWAEVCVEQFMELQKLYNTQKAIRQKEKVFKKLGKLYLNTYDYGKAQRYLTQALNLRHKIDLQQTLITSTPNEQKIQSIQQAQTLLQLGKALQKNGTYDKALTMLYKSEDIYKQNRQVESIGMAQVYLWIGKCISSTSRNLGEAPIKFSNSVQIMKKKKGCNSIQVAQVFESVAWYLIDEFQFDEAYEMGKKAYEIYFHLFGNGDRRTRNTLELMARAKRRTGFV